MEQEIQRRVLTLTIRSQNMMAEETGIQSSLSEEDMKDLPSEYALVTKNGYVRNN